MLECTVKLVMKTPTTLGSMTTDYSNKLYTIEHVFNFKNTPNFFHHNLMIGDPILIIFGTVHIFLQ